MEAIGHDTWRMFKNLVMTVLGADRPGLVEMMATQVAEHGGNWLESRMCRLGGQFAGIVRVEVPAERAADLVKALQALESRGLVVAPTDTAGLEQVPAGTPAVVEVVGQDRPGILRQVSRVLASHGVNVEDLASGCEPAPMDAGMIFRATASVIVPPGVTLAAVRADLERIAADLLVDVTLRAP
ncbi:MAG TPA: ACT domain-containing protein [Opitutaceae bacterium]